VFAQGVYVEPRDVCRRAQSEVHLNPVVFVKVIFLSQTFGYDEDVAEQNRRVKIEPADWFEVSLRRRVRAFESVQGKNVFP